MGCIVNGPGEAADADIGIIGGKSGILLIRKGKTINLLEEDEVEGAIALDHSPNLS